MTNKKSAVITIAVVALFAGGGFFVPASADMLPILETNSVLLASEPVAKLSTPKISPLPEQSKIAGNVIVTASHRVRSVFVNGAEDTNAVRRRQLAQAGLFAPPDAPAKYSPLWFKMREIDERAAMLGEESVTTERVQWFKTVARVRARKWK